MAQYAFNKARHQELVIDNFFFLIRLYLWSLLGRCLEYSTRQISVDQIRNLSDEISIKLNIISVFIGMTLVAINYYVFVSLNQLSVLENPFTLFGVPLIYRIPTRSLS